MKYVIITVIYMMVNLLPAIAQESIPEEQLVKFSVYAGMTEVKEIKELLATIEGEASLLEKYKRSLLHFSLARQLQKNKEYAQLSYEDMKEVYEQDSHILVLVNLGGIESFYGGLTPNPFVVANGLDKLNEALQRANDEEASKVVKSLVHFMRGNVYGQLPSFYGENKEAKKEFKAAIKTLGESDDKRTAKEIVVSVYIGFGDYYKNMGKLKTAKKYYQQAQKISDEFPEKPRAALIKKSIASVE